MFDDNNMEKAKKTFKTLCSYLDKNEWNYSKNENDLSIECSAQGEDLSMDMRVKIDPKRMIIQVLSDLPFVVDEKRRVEVAVAVSVVNNLLVDGSFDYEVQKGVTIFRMTNSFADSEIGEELFDYLIMCSFQTVDEYNDKFLMISKGIIPIEKFIESELN